MTEPLTKMFDANRRPQMLVIHGTAVDWAETNKILRGETDYEASCHYAISQTGEVVQYMDDRARAWHAGVSYWGGFTDINSISVGIELECVCPDATFKYPENTYSKAQMDKLVPLAKKIIEIYKIHPWNVVAHQDIAPYRKMDPGVNFDWQGLAQQGIGLWHDLALQKNDPVVDNLVTVQDFRGLLGLYGYDVRVQSDKSFSDVIRAFQTRFLPWNICGEVTEQSVAALMILLQKKMAQPL
jgi:N-acetylmuramoyl-L-alanine amidase